jgi:hypothetical protein
MGRRVAAPAEHGWRASVFSVTLWFGLAFVSLVHFVSLVFLVYFVFFVVSF